MKEFDVVTVGDINPDIIFTGVKRTPGMGKEVFARSVYISIGGGAANTAIGLARLGLKVALVSTIGKDMFGLNFLKLLEKEGVSKRYIKVQEKVNTGITVAITDENDRGFITYRGANELQRLEDINDELIKQTRHLHITNYSPDQKQRFMEISQIAKKYNVTISMDVGWDEAEKWDKGIMEALKKVDIFMPNEYEARGYSGKDDIYEALYYLSDYARINVIKLNKKGSIACDEKKAIVHAEGFKVESVDTTGAGDSFNAGFIYGFLNGRSMEQCLIIGNACGALSTTSFGGPAGFPNEKQLMEFLHRNKKLMGR